MSNWPADLCTDCGNAQVHEDAPGSKCRRCSEKSGHRYAFYKKIDIDKLRAVAGRELAEKIFAECQTDY
jgi:hypothetical protein